jgi:RNA polymerase sigma-70 factor (ECF subfamily)
LSSHVAAPAAAGGTLTSARFQRKRTLEDHDASSRAIVNRAVARAKAGDREALRVLYVTFSDNVYGYVCSILHDEHDAEDVTQQVFMKLMRVIGRYEQRSMPFSAWVLRVAHNAAIDHMRARRVIPCETVRGADDASDEVGIECRRSLQAALHDLPEEQRRVVVLRHVLGLSPGEIAAQMGKSENAVHGLHHRGRRAMRESLTRLGSAPTTITAA